MNISKNKNCNIKINNRTIEEKSAKEIFEELGFNSRQENYEKDKLIKIKYADYDKGNWITISLNSIEYVENSYRVNYIPVGLLQAVNK